MLDELREVLDDELPGYGFKEKTVLGYLNEGQDKFCEDTGFFSDTSTFTITTEAGKAGYALDSRIIRVEDVFAGARRLRKFTAFRVPLSAPDPLLWDTAIDSSTLTVWPTPSTVQTLSLHTWRYPKAELKATGVMVNPEIPKRMHRACIEWAAYKCYGHHDIELQGSAEALKHKASYRQYVLEGRALKRNMDAEQIVTGTEIDGLVV